MSKMDSGYKLSKSIVIMIAATGLTGAWGCGDNESPGNDRDAGADAGPNDGGPGLDGPETDVEAPAAVVVFPPPRSVTNAATLTVRGTAGDATAVEAVFVNGTAASSDDGFATWTAEITLAEGDNQVVVTTKDTLGNETGTAAMATVVRTAEIAPGASAVTWDRTRNRAVVLDANTTAIYVVDPQTRRRTLLSDGKAGTPALISPQAVAWDLQNERILVADTGFDPNGELPTSPAIIVVDPDTGVRSVLSDATTGSGTALTEPTGVVWDQRTNRALVLDGAPPEQRLVAIDASGARTEIASLAGDVMVATSVAWDEDAHRALVLDGFGKALYAVDVQNGSIAPLSAGGDGGANEFSLPVAVTWNPVEEEAVVTDLGLDALLAVNVQTGTRAVLASPSVGTGAVPRSPVGVTWDYAANRLLVVDSELGAVLAVDSASGDAQVLSDAYHGAGPALRSATALAWDPENNRALLADATLRGVMAIDPGTGDRTVLTAPSVGAGSALVAPVALTWDESRDRVLVLDANPGVLIAVDAATGQRILLSDGTDGVQPDLGAPRALAWDSYNSRAVVVNEEELVAVNVETGKRSIASRFGLLGEGPGFAGPRSVAVWTSEPGNDVVFVADSTEDALFYVSIDVETDTAGDRAVLSGASAGSGPAFARPIAVGWDPAREQALVLDGDLAALIGVDVATGNRTILSSADVGKGPAMAAPTAVVWDPTSTRVLVLDSQLRAVLAVDPVTGERVILAR
jgi:hypothetical protein